MIFMNVVQALLWIFLIRVRHRGRHLYRYLLSNLLNYKIFDHIQTQYLYQTCDRFHSKLNDVPCSFALPHSRTQSILAHSVANFLLLHVAWHRIFVVFVFFTLICSLDREWSLTSSFHTCSYQREITQFDSVCRSVEHYTHEEYIKKVALMCTHKIIIGFLILSLHRETWWNMGVSNLIIVDHRRSIIAIYIQLPLYLVHTDICVYLLVYRQTCFRT